MFTRAHTEIKDTECLAPARSGRLQGEPQRCWAVLYLGDLSPLHRIRAGRVCISLMLQFGIGAIPRQPSQTYLDCLTCVFTDNRCGVQDSRDCLRNRTPSRSLEADPVPGGDLSEITEADELQRSRWSTGFTARGDVYDAKWRM